MAHGIEPQDLIFSTSGTEWHGKANVVTSIAEEQINAISFPIIEGEVVCMVDGQTVKLDNYKTLIADLRHRGDGTQFELPVEDRLIPLHIPRASYAPISNRDVFQQAEEICQGLNMKIVTAGTLEGCKKFFVSIDTGSSDLIVKNHASGQSETVLAYIDLITSHDGTMAQETYDSMTRIVCMNTLRWSRQSKGNIGGKVYHTANSKTAMAAMAKRINDILSGRKVFVDTMERLSEQTLNHADARFLTSSYIAQCNPEGKSVRLSTRGANTVDGIVDLYKTGKGNVGRSFYDLFNGATEYWTSGDGTGKTVDALSKQYKGKFGGAADHKNDFLSYIDGGVDIANAIETGKALQAEYLKGKN